jgi:hypothetical protein
VFKHITAGNKLKPFHVRTAYADINIGGHGTTTLLRRDETNNNETNQAEDETAALKMEKENEILFSDKSYISENRMFAVII